MPWYTKVINWFRTKIATGVVGEELFGVYGGTTNSGISVDAFTALQSSAVLSCINIIAEDMAKLPIKIMRRTSNGGREEIVGNWASRLLRHPNDWQTRFEYVEMLMGHVLLRSNAYSVILRNSRGEVEQLIPIHPDRVTLFEAPGGQYFFFVTRQGLHEMAVLASMPLMIAAEDILHIRWLSTSRSLLGTSRISLMREAIGLGIALESHVAHVIGQGTSPGGVLYTDARLNTETVNRMKTSWQEGHAGHRHAGLVAVLESGLKYQPMEAMTNESAQILELRTFQQLEACRIWRVPAHKVGLNNSGPAANIAQAEQSYVNDVLLGWTERLKPKLEDIFGLDGRQEWIEFDFTSLLKADIKTQFETYAIGTNRMMITVNEAREAIGYPRLPNGDVLLQPVNYGPLGLLPGSGGGAGPGSDLTTLPGTGGDGDAGAAGRIPGDDVPSTLSDD